MEKSRKPHTLRSFLLCHLGRGGRRALIGLLARLANRGHDFHFPHDLQGARKILIVLPRDPLAALLQVGTVVSLLAQLKSRQVVLLGEQNMPALFRSIQGVGAVTQYDGQECFLFSRPYNRLAREIEHDGFDVCFYLGGQEDLELLYLVARSRSRLRIGLESAAGADFLNFRLRATPQGRHLSEQHLQLATIIGGKPVKNTKWIVPKETANEIEHLLAEAAIGKNQPLAGVDAQLLYERCGGEWLSGFVKELERHKEFVWYFFGEGTPSAGLMIWLKELHRPVFWGLSSSRLAALIHRSALIVSGRAPGFEMAYLLGTRAIGLFEQGELELYCRDTALSQGIVYSQAPDDRTLRRLIELLFSAKPG